MKIESKKVTNKTASVATKRSNVLSGRSLAFIGGGAMAGAMIGGLLNSHAVDAKWVTASDPHKERAKDLETRFGITTTTENLAAARHADIVILSVKPQMLRFVFRDLCGKLQKDALVLSIVAGARIDSMTQGLKHLSIVRSMPNTPAQVAEGMTVWTASPAVTPAQRAEAQSILLAFGKELYVADEAFLDMATAISGSGPSYVFLFMEALIDAAVHLGFSREDARTLVTQTVRGSAIYAENSAVASRGNAQPRDVARRHQRACAVPARKRRVPNVAVEGRMGRVPAQRLALGAEQRRSAVRRTGRGQRLRSIYGQI